MRPGRRACATSSAETHAQTAARGKLGGAAQSFREVPCSPSAAILGVLPPWQQAHTPYGSTSAVSSQSLWRYSPADVSFCAAKRHIGVL